MRLHAQTPARELLRARRLRSRAASASSRRASSTWRWRSALPELRIDPLSGLRTIVAGERADRARAPSSTSAERPPIDPERRPVPRGPRGPHAAGALRPARRRRRPTRPAGRCAWCRTSTRRSRRATDGAARRPAGGGPRRARAVRRAPGRRRARGDRERARRRWPRCASSTPSSSRPRWASGASACAHHAERGLRAPDRERGPRGRRLAAAHPRAALRARRSCPAAVARERERFTAYSDRTQGRNLLEDLLQEEVRRRERIVAVDDEAVAICPFAARVPVPACRSCPRRPARAVRGRGPARRARCCTTSLGAPARRCSAALPPLNLWVRTAPRGRRALLLADRRCCRAWRTSPGSSSGRA